MDAEVERDEPLVLQALGHVAVDDALGEALDDGGLADARLADEHRVVLGAPDSTWMTRRISSSRPMTGSTLPSAAAFVRSRPYFSSAWYCSSGFCEVTRWLPRTAFMALSSSSRLSFEAVVQREEQVLDGQVLVLQLLALLVGLVERLGQVAVQAGVGTAVGLGQLAHGLVGGVAQRQRRDAGLLQHGQRDGVLLPEDGRQEVVDGELGVGQGLRLFERGGEGLLRLLGPAVRIEGHGGSWGVRFCREEDGSARRPFRPPDGCVGALWVRSQQES
jgi:hypothetical protein